MKIKSRISFYLPLFKFKPLYIFALLVQKKTFIFRFENSKCRKVKPTFDFHCHVKNSLKTGQKLARSFSVALCHAYCLIEMLGHSQFSKNSLCFHLMTHLSPHMNHFANFMIFEEMRKSLAISADYRCMVPYGADSAMPISQTFSCSQGLILG